MRSLISAIMNKFKFYFILFSLTFILFSCDKSSSDSAIPIRDFAVQYTADIAIIEDYLTTHYLVVDDNQEVTISKITNPLVQSSMMSLLNSETYPKLLVKEVALDDIIYKLYYFKLKADNSSSTAIAPSRADEVLTSYRGSYLFYSSVTEEKVTTTTLNSILFEYTPNPLLYFRLDAVVRGWTEIMPLFKSGDKVDVVGEPISYTDFGAGIIFIPSGLGYYNRSQPGIPSYSPLVFSFKLLQVKFGDQDQDGILSNNEDLNGDGDFTNDDTDGDGVQNLYDVDDDGDGYFTLTETKRPNVFINGVSTTNGYYPYNGDAADDPLSLLIDESQGVPNCNADFTSPTRLRKYLDPSCH